MQGWGIVFLGGSGELELGRRKTTSALWFPSHRSFMLLLLYAYISLACLPHAMTILMDGRLDARVCNSTPEP